jgi:hypothetical protein
MAGKQDESTVWTATGEGAKEASKGALGKLSDDQLAAAAREAAEACEVEVNERAKSFRPRSSPRMMSRKLD